MSTDTPFGRVRTLFEGPNTTGGGQRFWVGFVVVVALLGIYPFLFGSYAASNASQFLLSAILALSLCFVWGYAGILSFGQVVFYGIAGYCFGIISLNLDSALTTMLALPIAVLAATAVAFVLGYFMFYGRVRDVYVTILTLVVTLVMSTFMAQTAGSEWAIGSVALGGFNGIPGIPTLPFGIGPNAPALTSISFYWFTLVSLVVIYLGLRALVNSRYGYAMVAVREDEDRTRMLGYDIRKIKLLVFTLGGAIAGFSGVLYVSWGNYINPSVFGLTFASIPVVWVTVGGRRSLLGAIVASVVIEWFRQQLAITGSEYAIVAVGALLLVVVLVLPEGIVPWIESRVDGLAAGSSANDRTEAIE